MAVIIDGNEIVLTGTVGGIYWFEDCFTASDVIRALATIGRDKDVVVRLNSGGGIATEGTAIHAALAAHKGKVEVIVEGIAASAASIVAVAGSKLTMALGSVMMIHDAGTVVYDTSTASELGTLVDALNALSGSMASIYADRTGKPVDEMRALMQAETWMTAEEAVEAGFADAVGGKPVAERSEPTAFNYRLYAHAPSPMLALADARGWSAKKPPAAAAAPTARTQETLMSTPTTPAAPAPTAPDLDSIRAEAATEAVRIDRERRAGIMALAEAKGREGLAEHCYMTGMSVDAAKAMLAAAPAPATADTTPLTPPASADPQGYADERARAAAGLAQPGGEGKADVASRVLANYRTVTGAPAKKA